MTPDPQRTSGNSPFGSGPPPKGPPVFNMPPIVTWTIGAIVLAHLARMIVSEEAEFFLFSKLAYIPVRFASEGGIQDDLWATFLSPIGYTLLHADFMHLFMNMAFLAAFGSVVARRMSEAWFLFLYVVTAIAGVLCLQLLSPESVAVVIGASAAVSGMVGAVAAVAFRRKPNSPPLPRPFNEPRNAAMFILVWIVLSVVFGLIPGAAFGIEGRIAWEAHLGGFAIGALIMPFLDMRGKKQTFPLA